MDLTQYILLTAVIAGITQLLAHLRARDFWGATTIACAAVTGLVFGLFGVEGLTAVTGLAAGFGTSGAVTILGKLSASGAAAVTPNTSPTNKG
jgi:uncharacterized membrane protein HdeD (DUF308 family)